MRRGHGGGARRASSVLGHARAPSCAHRYACVACPHNKEVDGAGTTPLAGEEEGADDSASVIPSSEPFVRSSSQETNPYEVQREKNISERRRMEAMLGLGPMSSLKTQGNSGKKKH